MSCKHETDKWNNRDYVTSLTSVVGCRCWMTRWTSSDTIRWVTKRVDAEQTPASTRRRLTARRQFQQLPSRRQWTRTMTRRACRVLICPLEPCRTARIPQDPRQHRDMSATLSTGRTPTSLKQLAALNRVQTSGLFSLCYYKLKAQFTLTVWRKVHCNCSDVYVE